MNDIQQQLELARQKTMNLVACQLCGERYLMRSLRDPRICNKSGCQNSYRSAPRWVPTTYNNSYSEGGQNKMRPVPQFLSEKELQGIRDNTESVISRGAFHDVRGSQ